MEKCEEPFSAEIDSWQQKISELVHYLGPHEGSIVNPFTYPNAKLMSQGRDPDSALYPNFHGWQQKNNNCFWEIAWMIMKSELNFFIDVFFLGVTLINFRNQVFQF